MKHICPNCQKQHKVEYGKKLNNETGEYEESKLLGAVKCNQNGKSYLVMIKNESVYPNKPNNVVFMSGLEEEEE